MAYDPVKAHEYYMKYRKKGLLKGRKKGRKKSTSKKAKQQTLVGLSTGGLNDAGKMQWAMTKKDLQTQMNAELSNATTPEQKAEIIKDYQNKALKALQDMKKDPSLAKEKKSKSTKSSKSSGAKSKNSSSDSSSNSSKGNSKSKKSASASAPKLVSHGSASKTARTVSNEEFAKIKEMSEQIEQLKSQLATMSEIQKSKIRTSVQAMIVKLKKRKKNG